MLIPLEQIEPDPKNVRDDEGDVSELVASIRATGLVNPLSVYPVARDVFGLPSRWRLAAGHRRRKALLILAAEDPEKWGQVECNPREAPTDELERLDTMVAENLHREQLNPIEEARAYKAYFDAGLSQTQIQERTGRAQGTVSYALLWLETLTPEEQDQLARGQMTRAKATEVVKARRKEAGTARTDSGGEHRYGKSVPWFNNGHPRAGEAQELCRRQAHDPRLRLGPACGPCWEATLTDGRTYATPEPLDLPDALALLNLFAGCHLNVQTATPLRIRKAIDRATERIRDDLAEWQRQQDRARPTVGRVLDEAASGRVRHDDAGLEPSLDELDTLDTYDDALEADSVAG